MKVVQVVFETYLLSQNVLWIVNGGHDAASLLLGREAFDKDIALIWHQEIARLCTLDKRSWFFTSCFWPANSGTVQMHRINQRDSIICRLGSQERGSAKVDDTPCRYTDSEIRERS